MSPASKPAVSLAEPVAAPSAGQVALRFGVGAGLVCAAWVVFLQLTGNNAFGPKQIMGLLAVPLAAMGSQWWLRYRLAPALPGVGRMLAVGSLTVLLAAGLAAASAWGLAYGAGEKSLKLAQAEMVEIVRVEQQQRDPQKRNPQLEQRELQQATTVSIGGFAFGTFVRAVMLGLLAAIPAGIFLRK